MDAIEFLKERRRMYESGADTPCIGLWDDYDPVSAVKVVREWSAAHPRKTRQSLFLEKYPNAYILEEGYLGICPAVISKEYENNTDVCGDPDMSCAICARKFWLQEAE